MYMLLSEQVRRWPTWSLRATWCPRAPCWWHLIYTNNMTFLKPFSKDKAMCEIPQQLGYFFQMNKIQWKKRFCYLVSTTLTQNQKMHHCVIQLNDHQIVDSDGPKNNQSKKFTQFCSFLKVYRDDFSHAEINRDVCGTCFYVQMTKTSGIHKVYFQKSVLPSDTFSLLRKLTWKYRKIVPLLMIYLLPVGRICDLDW